MFRSVRDEVGSAWRGVRVRGTLRLFAFEFFVVVLGVLTAQMVQDWSQEREHDAQAREELSRLSAKFYDMREAGEVWRAASPCLRAGVEQLMRAAAEGRNPDPALLRRPRLYNAGYPDATTDTWRRIRDLIGNQPMLALEDTHVRADNLRTHTGDIIARWEKFRLLDPTLGPVSLADRSVARTAGVEILIALRNIDIVVINLDENDKPFRGTDPEPFDPQLDSSPVRSCAAIWKYGRIYRRPGD